jgi:hypothetical protein
MLISGLPSVLILRNLYLCQEYEEYDEAETTEVEQQALLPSVKDPKLWMVKCLVFDRPSVLEPKLEKLSVGYSFVGSIWKHALSIAMSVYDC